MAHGKGKTFPLAESAETAEKGKNRIIWPLLFSASWELERSGREKDRFPISWFFLCAISYELFFFHILYSLYCILFPIFSICYNQKHKLEG